MLSMSIILETLTVHCKDGTPTYHDSAHESIKLRFDKFPQDVPLERRLWVFGCDSQRDVVIHICLAVSDGAEQSCRDSEHRWAQDEL